MNSASGVGQINAIAVWLLLERKTYLASDRVSRWLRLVILSAVAHFGMKKQKLILATRGAAVAGNVRAHAAASCVCVATAVPDAR